MRITGGTLKGRPLRAPDGMGTRPTADRVREALFNILAHHDWGEALGDPLEGAIVLDAFAGTGALGIEAISRGASSCTFFEKDRKALTCLKENLRLLGDSKAITVLPVDVTRPPKAMQAATLVFLDPPYHKGLIEAALSGLTAQGWIAPHALLVCETAKDETLALPAPFTIALERTYGDTKLWFVCG